MKYRIKKTWNGYIIQKRVLWFFWSTLYDPMSPDHILYFTRLHDAEEYLRWNVDL